MMILEVKFKIHFKSNEEAETTYRSLLPDNIGIGEKVTLLMNIKGNTLSIFIKGGDFNSVIHTIEDILRCMSVVLQLIE